MTSKQFLLAEDLATLTQMQENLNRMKSRYRRIGTLNHAQSGLLQEFEKAWEKLDTQLHENYQLLIARQERWEQEQAA